MADSMTDDSPSSGRRAATTDLGGLAVQVAPGGYVALLDAGGVGSLWRVVDRGRSPRVEFVGTIRVETGPSTP